jgi:LPS-assembly protein
MTPEVSLHERLYDTDADDDHQFVPEYSLTLATRLIKTYLPNRWGMDGLMHSVEPKLVYTYVPDKSQDDLPLFDLFDRQIQRNDISYALVNRLTTSKTNENGTTRYRDFLNLRLSQSYRFDNEDDLFDDDQPFSDVRLELDFWPTRNVVLGVDSLIPVYGSSNLRTMRVAASARDDAGNAAKVNYTYLDDTFQDAATDYINFHLDTSLFKPVYVRFEERYDFRDSRELEKIVGLEYRSKCWSILLTYRGRYRENDSKDHEVMFSFVLAGLGMNKGFGGGFGLMN